MVAAYGPEIEDSFWAQDQSAYFAQFRVVHEALADVALEMLPAGDLMLQVVDVGCGGGRLLKLIHQRASRSGLYMTGIDFSVAGLEAAHDHFSWPLYLERDIASHDFKTSLTLGNADLVICCLTLDFIPDTYTALTNMLALLRDGGKLLLCVKDGSVLRHSLDAHRWTLAQFDCLCQMFGGKASPLLDGYLQGVITK